jgi:hypothetical protein
MEEFTFVLTIASIIIPVCATIICAVYTVEKRVKAEHKPYIVLDSIQTVNLLDKCLYFIVLVGNKFKNKSNGSENESDPMIDNNINVKIKVKNIGYGVATNVRFYNLDTGLKINGNQVVDNRINQQLFTTFDIAANDDRSVQTSLAVIKENNVIVEDSINTLCIYQDLNGNVYNFVFVVDIKSGGGYSYYAYQPSSHSYQELMKKYSKQKHKIFSDYNN